MDEDLTPGVVKDDPSKPWKAYVATALAFVTIVASAWIADDGGVTSKDVVGWIISALVGSGLTGVGTFLKANPKTVA